MILPKIYPITNTVLTDLSHTEQVEILTGAGATLIQLREKHLSPRDFFADARNALRNARERGAKIIINDRVDLALALGADGVHLGQDDLPPGAARAILGNDAIIGFSTHSVEQALAAVNLPVDYLAIGPIFQTKTKDDPDEAVGFRGIEEVRAAIGDFPLVAIGGIDESSLLNVLGSGADSAAIIKALLKPSNALAKNYSRLIGLV